MSSLPHRASPDAPLGLAVTCFLVLLLTGLLLLAWPVQLAVLPLTALVPTLLSYRFSSAGAGRGQQLPWLVVVAAAGAVLTVALSILTATLVLQHKTSEGEFEGAATGLGLAVVTPLLALLGAVCALAGAVIGRRHRAPPSGRAT